MRAAREMASSSLHSLTVLTEEDGVPVSKFEKRTRRMHCRPAKTVAKMQRLKDLVQRVRDCVRSENYHTLDPAIDHGKWFAAKVLHEHSDGKDKFWIDIHSVYSVDLLACFSVSKHSFALQLWARALLHARVHPKCCRSS